MMNSNEIREMFLKYFKKHKHEIIDSYPLVPINDDSLLFVNAGVTPLKKYFDGSISPKNKRMTSSQKCIRTNDIDNVGKTSRHHTMFEMLGNFSIGDYFKKDAIKLAFEFLTGNKYLNFDIEKLYVTVYPSDLETIELWVNLGIKSENIIKLEGNFWELDSGPCGPCTEIFYDRGVEFDPDNQGITLLEEDLDNDRYIEIWNIVFSTYNKDPNLDRKDYEFLPNKNIDTGMGLERITSIIQNTNTNFETDLFMPYIKRLEEISNMSYDSNKMSFRVIADHIRTIVCALYDNAIFSNEKRGYILRRLLRRCVMHGLKLNINDVFLSSLVDDVVSNMKPHYNMDDKINVIKELILNEELLFKKTLSSGEKLLKILMEKSDDKIISGEDAFKLYDTYGFPFELTLEYLNEHGYTTSIVEFSKYMQEQKEISKKNNIKEAHMNKQNVDLMNYTKLSEFVGYDKFTANTIVDFILDKDGCVVDTISDEGYVILEKTPFFAESGGQISDTGVIYNNDFKADVLNVTVSFNKQHVHYVKVLEGTINLNATVDAKINVKRREDITANHSAAHLLQQALKEVISKDIFQAGSHIDVSYGRFDFNYNKKLSDKDILKIEEKVSELISTRFETKIEYMPLNEARENNYIALFEDTYDEIVRVVHLNDSHELCGGTHILDSDDIKRFAIKELENKGANTYRITFATNDYIPSVLFEAIKPYNDEEIKMLNKVKNILEEAKSLNIYVKFDCDINNETPYSYSDVIDNKIELENVKLAVHNLELDFSEKKLNKILENLDEFINDIIVEDEIAFLIKNVDGYDSKALKHIADNIINKMDKGFVFLMSTVNDKTNFLCKITDNYNEIQANDVIRYVSGITKGKGGGSSKFAQGGTDNKEVDLDKIIKLINKNIFNS